MPRPCTAGRHPDRDNIDEALLSGTAIRDIAGQYALAKSAVDRHRSHIGVALTAAARRRAELEVDRPCTGLPDGGSSRFLGIQGYRRWI